MKDWQLFLLMSVIYGAPHLSKVHASIVSGLTFVFAIAWFIAGKFP